jgi:hypothetical protein
MLQKAINKFKKIGKDPSNEPKPDKHPNLKLDGLFQVNYGHLQEIIEYLFAQSKLFEEALSDIVEKMAAESVIEELAVIICD